MPSPIRAVFFDLGGTLFSNLLIPRISAPVLKEAARRLGVNDSMASVGPAFVRASMTANKDYKDRPFYLHRDLFQTTYEGFAVELGATPPPDFFDWIYEAQREVMVNRISLREDCVETLRGLRERGLGLSIVSNIDDDYLGPMMQSLDLEPHFDHWSSSEEARSCKPHRGIFELALTKSGHGPDEVLFVGDSRTHDITGSRAMGMTPVLIEEHMGQSHLDVGGEDPDHTIGRLSELLPLVDARRE